MADQPLDQLEPGGLQVRVVKRGVREPNAPGNSDDKMKRLRKLLWSEEWSDKNLNLIAWSDTDQCWYMWRPGS